MALSQIAETLVLDTAPLLRFSDSLRKLAARFVTVQAVLDEVKDARARETLSNLAHLTLDGGSEGFVVRNPSPQALERVTAFARHTGDIAALSLTDLAVLALTVTIAAEARGWDSIALPAQVPPDAPEHPSPTKKQKQAVVAAEAEDAATSEEESDDGEGEWITPSNIAKKSKQTEAALGVEESNEPVAAACMTSDFAMQNVLLQMGLTVCAPSGQRIRNVKTWVLRCHGCYRLCKDQNKRFCPHCGGNTLTRTSITYVTPTRDNPKGYILHLKRNYQYRTRGTVYSIPNPLAANAKGAAKDELVLREDQREYQRGLKNANVVKAKQEKAMARAAAEGIDPDWMPSFLVDDKSRKLQTGRIGKDGLPLVGYGRSNPNEVRRKR